MAWADRIRSWSLDWETGIYPGEMAAFLALCDHAGVVTIVESGRGLHAYSTQVLGGYAEQTGARVVSIDMETDSAAAAHCRARLARYPSVTCLAGDAFEVFPDAMSLAAGPAALLLDGPKDFGANRLSLTASLLYPISVIGHHNADPGTEWTEQFARLFPGAFHYETLADDSPRWREFKAWEREAVKGYELPGNPGRSLSRSSLVLAEVAPGVRPPSLLSGLGGFRDVRSTKSLMRRWERRRAEIVRGR